MKETVKVVVADDEMISRGYMELFIKRFKQFYSQAVVIV